MKVESNRASAILPSMEGREPETAREDEDPVCIVGMGECTNSS